MLAIMAAPIYAKMKPMSWIDKNTQISLMHIAIDEAMLLWQAARTHDEYKLALAKKAE